MRVRVEHRKLVEDWDGWRMLLQSTVDALEMANMECWESHCKSIALWMLLEDLVCWTTAATQELG